MVSSKISLLGLIIMLIGVVIYLPISLEITSASTHNVITSCYDGNNNIINGITCNKEVFDNNGLNRERDIILGAIGLLGFMLIIMGVLILSIGTLI